MRKVYRYILFLLPLYWSCANQIPLDGGEVEKIPPKLVKAEPDTMQVNFTGNSIELEFDEYLNLRNPAQELVVSPPLDEQPTVKLRNKTVLVEFKTPLEPNTTYSLNFGNAITDYNEGNVAKNFTYVFSTGSYIDSLTLKSDILDAFTLKPLTDMKFMIYKTWTDTTPSTTRPYNMALSDANGSAVIPYLPAGAYRAFVLKDLNANFLYDLPLEEIGFIDSLLTPSDSVIYRITTFREEVPAQRLKSAKSPYPGKVYFKFDGDASSAVIQPLTDSLTPLEGHIEWGNEIHDSLVYWYDPVSTDSVAFRVKLGETVDTVVSIFPRVLSNKSKNSGSSKLSLTSLASGGIDYFKAPEFVFSRPVKEIDTSRMSLKKENLEIPYTIEWTDSVRRKFQLKFTMQQGMVYSLTFADSSVKDHFNQFMDSTSYNLKITLPADYVNFTVNVQHFQGKGNGILQLLDKDDKVVTAELLPDSSMSVTFERVRTGDYRLKLLYDDNKNGKWDTGNFDLYLQPEKVSYFPQNIQLKPNFDMIYDWDLAPVQASGRLNDKFGGRE